MSIRLNSEYAPITVARLVNIFNCLTVYDQMAKINERLPDMTPMLDETVSQKIYIFNIKCQIFMIEMSNIVS